MIIHWENKEEGQNVAWVHTDTLLSSEPVSTMSSRASNEEKGLVEKMLSIRGVQDVTVNRYKVRVERTRVVGWDEITRGIEEVIRQHRESSSSLSEA